MFCFFLLTVDIRCDHGKKKKKEEKHLQISDSKTYVMVALVDKSQYNYFHITLTSPYNKLTVRSMCALKRNCFYTALALYMGNKQKYGSD